MHRHFFAALLLIVAAPINNINIRNLGPEFKAFWQAAEHEPTSKQAQLFKQAFTSGNERHTFFEQLVFSYQSKDAKLDELLTKEWEGFAPLYEIHAARIQELFDRFNGMVENYLKRFTATFTDAEKLLRDGGVVVYGIPSLGNFGGRVRNIRSRQQRIVAFGLDTIIIRKINLDIIFPHELFHAYQEVANPDGNRGREAAPLISSLWVEGLASYVSTVLNPGIDDGEVLLDHELAARCPKAYRSFAKRYLQETDGITQDNWEKRHGEQIFRRWFLFDQDNGHGHGQGGTLDPEVPPAAGYCLGLMVCRELGKSATPQQMAAWKFPQFRQRIENVLHEFAK